MSLLDILGQSPQSNVTFSGQAVMLSAMGMQPFNVVFTYHPSEPATIYMIFRHMVPEDPGTSMMFDRDLLVSYLVHNEEAGIGVIRVTGTADEERALLGRSGYDMVTLHLEFLDFPYHGHLIMDRRFVAQFLKATLQKCWYGDETYDVDSWIEEIFAHASDTQ